MDVTDSSNWETMSCWVAGATSGRPTKQRPKPKTDNKCSNNAALTPVSSSSKRCTAPESVGRPALQVTGSSITYPSGDARLGWRIRTDWDLTDGSTLSLLGRITDVRKSSRGGHKYQIAFDDGDLRWSRLRRLKWDRVYDPWDREGAGVLGFSVE